MSETHLPDEVVKALVSRLETLVGPIVARNTAPPSKVASGGLIIVRDGELDEPEDEQLLGADGPFWYEHTIELEIYVQALEEAVREASAADLYTRVATVLDADESLGGLVEGLIHDPPVTDTELVPGEADIKAATKAVVVEYESTTRL